MKSMKNYVVLCLAAIVLVFVLAACQDPNNPFPTVPPIEDQDVIEEFTPEELLDSRTELPRAIIEDAEGDQRTTDQPPPEMTVQELVFDFTTVDLGEPEGYGRITREFRTEPNWLYRLEKEPAGGSAMLCSGATFIDGKLSSCLGTVASFRDNPDQWYFMVTEPTKSSLQIDRWTRTVDAARPADSMRFVVTITRTANDHGTGADDATVIPIGTPIAGELWEASGPRDWFAFDAKAGESYLAQVSLGTLQGAFLDLYVPGSSNAGGFGENVMRFTTSTTGRHAIVVRGVNRPCPPEPCNAFGTYVLTVTPDQ